LETTNNPNHETYVEDEGEGKFALYLEGSRVVWIGPTFANPSHRECHWSIRGPCDLDKSIALMKGFLHLTALLGNEQRASDQAPAITESLVEPKGRKKWRNSKTIRRSRT
jgi:hypothetical protein